MRWFRTPDKIITTIAQVRLWALTITLMIAETILQLLVIPLLNSNWPKFRIKTTITDPLETRLLMSLLVLMKLNLNSFTSNSTTTNSPSVIQKHELTCFNLKLTVNSKSNNTAYFRTFTTEFINNQTSKLRPQDKLFSKLRTQFHKTSNSKPSVNSLMDFRCSPKQSYKTNKFKNRSVKRKIIYRCYQLVRSRKMLRKSI